MLARPRAGAPLHVLPHEIRGVAFSGPAQTRQLQGVADDVVGGGNAANDLLKFEDLRSAERRRCRRRFVRRRPLDDFHLLVLLRVIDEDVVHEAVELGLGERIGPLVLDGVLRGQDEERLAQPMPLPAGGDLVLLHRLQKGGLRLRRRAVDLVGEDDVAEDRPLEELELPRPGPLVLLDHLRAGDVRGHEVGGELDAAELQRQGVGQGADHQRLGQPRHADQQAMPACEHRRQQFLDDLLLADDDAGQLFGDEAGGLVQLLDGLDVVFLQHDEIAFLNVLTALQIADSRSPLPPGEGWGEGKPVEDSAVRFSPVSQHPLTPALSRRERGTDRGQPRAAQGGWAWRGGPARPIPWDRRSTTGRRRRQGFRPRRRGRPDRSTSSAPPSADRRRRFAPASARRRNRPPRRRGRSRASPRCPAKRSAVGRGAARSGRSNRAARRRRSSSRRRRPTSGSRLPVRCATAFGRSRRRGRRSAGASAGATKSVPRR